MVREGDCHRHTGVKLCWGTFRQLCCASNYLLWRADGVKSESFLGAEEGMEAYSHMPQESERAQSRVSNTMFSPDKQQKNSLQTRRADKALTYSVQTAAGTTQWGFTGEIRVGRDLSKEPTQFWGGGAQLKPPNSAVWVCHTERRLLKSLSEISTLLKSREVLPLLIGSQSSFQVSPRRGHCLSAGEYSRRELTAQTAFVQQRLGNRAERVKDQQH